MPTWEGGALAFPTQTGKWRQGTRIFWIHAQSSKTVVMGKGCGIENPQKMTFVIGAH